MIRRAARVDANQREIVRALRQLGYLVLSLAPMGKGVPDVLVYRRDRGYYLVEIKTAKGQLTDEQQKFLAQGWPVKVIRSWEEL